MRKFKNYSIYVDINLEDLRSYLKSLYQEIYVNGESCKYVVPREDLKALNLWMKENYPLVDVLPYVTMGPQFDGHTLVHEALAKVIREIFTELGPVIHLNSGGRFYGVSAAGDAGGYRDAKDFRGHATFLAFDFAPHSTAEAMKMTQAEMWEYFGTHGIIRPFSKEPLNEPWHARYTGPLEEGLKVEDLIGWGVPLFRMSTT